MGRLKDFITNRDAEKLPVSKRSVILEILLIVLISILVVVIFLVL